MLVFWAPTNEILAVACPNKVVGITQVPIANSARILVGPNVSGHFRGFLGFWAFLISGPNENST
jgi:hypothetical protein